MYLVISIVILLLCFYFLAIVCDEFFVGALEKISKKLRISSEVTGATLMAIGSSAPEFFTSFFALFAIFGSGGNEWLGAGTIVGSAIFNVLVITWFALIFTKSRKKLYRQPVVRDLVFYALTILLLLLFFWDGKMMFSEVIVMVVLYIAYVFVVSKWSKWLKYNVDKEDIVHEVEVETKKHPITAVVHKFFWWIIPNPRKHHWLSFIVSIVMIAVLSYIMVESAVYFADGIGIPRVIIWLTILAAGTSVPDLISSIIVAKKWKTDMAVSNGLWSNIFDILIGLGLVYFIYFLVYGSSQIIPVDTNNLVGSVILLFATVIVIISVFVLYKRKTNKWIGWFLVILYVLYLGYNIYLVLR